MELTSSTGTAMTLTIEGYQFPDAVGGDDGPSDYANWLVVRGRIRSAAAAWEFSDPCLLTGETTWLAAWLRDVVDGSLPVVRVSDAVWDQEHPGVLSFLEPNLSFGLQSRTDRELVVRLFLSHEALPPGHDLADVVHVDLVVTPEQLRSAAAAWDAEREVFPPRA